MTSSARFVGKTILVTGAGGSVGSTVTADVLAEGGTVLAVDVSQDRLHDVASRLRSDRLITVVADVTSEVDVTRVAGVASEQFGRIDGFLNNAGIEGRVNKITDVTVDEFTRVWNVNVLGALLGIKHVLPIMREGGSILNVGSTASMGGSLGMVAYVASKHAILGLTRTAAIEARELGVRVNCLCPGAIESPMMASIDEQRIERFGSSPNAPLRTYLSPSDVSRAALEWLLPGSVHVSGNAISVS